MLPNEHNVYLHDTSANPALFARSRRAFSHGCIRVAEPAALARYVLKDDPHWSDAAIEAAMAASKSLQVDLAEPIRVYIMYATASTDAGGTVHFHEDVYGLEADNS
jgi:murein L,D-transpeptidase YcbB/YkuD